MKEWRERERASGEKTHREIIIKRTNKSNKTERKIAK